MAQLLTPAPTAREIEWKRAVFKHGDHEHTDIKPERIERAIADDVEFLRTHPTRRSGKQGMDPKKLEERRAFKAATRARVALYAERNGIDKANSRGSAGSSTNTLQPSPIVTGSAINGCLRAAERRAGKRLRINFLPET